MAEVPRGTSAAAAAITFTVIATLTLIARLFTRFVLVKNAGKEEVAIVFAWAFCAAHTCLVYVQILNGLGDHESNLSSVEQSRILLPFWVSVPVYSVSLFLTKVSILLLYIRLFPDDNFIRACRIIIVGMAAFLVWTIFGFMFMCTPVQHVWDPSVPGTCMNPKIVYFTNAPFNILTDFVLFGLPLPILWKLQVPRRQKIGLILLFTIGLVGCLTSILRLRSLFYLSISTDITYDNLDIATWSSVEANVGICCACVPTIKPIVTALIPCLPFDRSTRKSRSVTYGINPADSDIALAPNSQNYRTYALFDKDCELQVPAAGKVRVTTDIEQEINDK